MCKLGRAHFTLVRFLSGMQSKVGLEIACAAKSLVADLKCGDKRRQRKETGKIRFIVASGRDNRAISSNLGRPEAS